MENAMEITPFMLYLCTISDSIIKISKFLALFFCICMFINGLAMISKSEYARKMKIFFITSATLFVLFLFTAVLVPSTKNIAIMIGIPYVLNDLKCRQIDNIPPRWIEFVNLYIEREILKIENSNEEIKNPIKKDDEKIKQD